MAVLEKRYQVFISSTFQDLQNARQEVSQALLRADCFPAGMELFPAADEEQFAFIKTVIDQSDYYIIISAGRYGSIHPETGLSYTEMEYDYAVETGKPVIRLLHKDPFNELKGQFIEPTDVGKEKLQDFRNKMRASRLVGHWSNELELGLRVREALEDAKKRFPAKGWVKAENGNELPPELETFSKVVPEIADDTGVYFLSQSTNTKPEFYKLPDPPFDTWSLDKFLSTPAFKEYRFTSQMIFYWICDSFTEDGWQSRSDLIALWELHMKRSHAYLLLEHMAECRLVSLWEAEVTLPERGRKMCDWARRYEKLRVKNAALIQSS
ncbi:MAG: DUF4062 domain-containing protein [Rhodobacter sp.]|nr:DUF4062 domain-containing protein [Rhodobacter sp.]